MRRLRVSELEPGPSETGARWLPLRAALGLEAFGLSGYVGDTGETLVPLHSESGGGSGQHQELYAVLRGRAQFEVEDEVFDADAGTLVVVERGERRRAVSTEDGTFVLAAGGAPGKAYRIAPWEYGARAQRARALGDVDELDRVATEGTAAYGEHVTMVLAHACVAAQRGETERARALLDQAYADPELGDWARAEAAKEPLLDPVRG